MLYKTSPCREKTIKLGEHHGPYVTTAGIARITSNESFDDGGGKTAVAGNAAWSTLDRGCCCADNV